MASFTFSRPIQRNSGSFDVSTYEEDETTFNTYATYVYFLFRIKKWNEGEKRKETEE